MERLMPRIREIAERITSEEEKRRRVAGMLRKPGTGEGLFTRLEPDPLEDLKVVGVDGGIVKKSLHGFDCMLSRAAGVCFHYRRGEIGKVDYLPSRMPVPEPEVMEALSDLDWAYFTSISRQRQEVRTASECLQRFSPGLLMMDGSIVPHYTSRPPKSSRIYEDYRKLMGECRDLFRKSRESGTCLIGVIEDSRGDSFCRMLRDDIANRLEQVTDQAPESDLKDVLEKTRDTGLLFWMLKKGEKSITFPYSRDPEKHPVLRDLGDEGRDILSFYLKTAEHDRPVRVDFLKGAGGSGTDEACSEERVASVLLSISGQHPGYGLPAPLIEADNVAKLSEDEINNFYSRVLSFTGTSPGMMRLRRDQRPF